MCSLAAVWEWCGETGQADLDSGPVTDPHGLEKGDGRVLRGGSWGYDRRLVRSAIRNRNEPSYHFDNLGFRLARGR
ncbi:MAG: formylglycine-generating enzyme family protein [Desulfobulbus sp.]